MKATTLSISASLKPLTKKVIRTIEVEPLSAENYEKCLQWKTWWWAQEFQAWLHLGSGQTCPQAPCSYCSWYSPVSHSYKMHAIDLNLCFTQSTKNENVNEIRLVKAHTSSNISSPLAPLMATGLRLRSTWTMWQSVPPVTMLYLKLKAS